MGDDLTEIGAVGARFRAGDHAAFTALYDHAARGIHDFLARLVHDRSAAEDLTQATFLRAYERRDALGEPDRVVGWLYAIARNLALDHLRRRRPEATLTGLEEPTVPSPEADPAEAALRNEAVALVWDAAASLEPRQAAVLDLSLRQGLGATDIATVLETTPDNAAVLVHRAKAALGNAVRLVGVARRRGRCERLDQLVPAGVRQLTPAQRKTVDHHLRRCETCRDTGALVVAPEAVYASVPLIALPTTLRLAPALDGPPIAPAPTAAKAGVPVAAKVAAVLVVAVVLVTAGLLVARARDAADSAAATTTTTVPANPGGAPPAGPTSSAPLVDGGSGKKTFLSFTARIVATTGCEGDFYRSAPDPGEEVFLLGNVRLDGDRLVLDGTSDAYEGELHTDGVVHLGTGTAGSSQSTIDARLADDGTLTGVWHDVFLGDCVLHAEIGESDGPTRAELTS